MTKVCVIGNSHVAAVRLGWDKAAAEFPELDVTIFGAHSRNLVTAAMDADGALGCDGPPFWLFRAGEEPGRARRIPVRDYEAFVIAGCDFGPMNVFRSYKRYGHAGFKGKRPQLLSRAQFATAVSRAAGESAAVLLASLIRPAAAAPIYLVPAPLPSENGYADRDARNMEFYIAAREAGDGEMLMQHYAALASEIAGKGFRIVEQEEATRASAISTLHAFSEGSVRLRADDEHQHGETDYLHMNALYGHVMWRKIAAAIAQDRA